jgi:glutathione S-transferase
VDGRDKPGHDRGKFFKEFKMKLIFSQSSPFVRKVRIAAIELGLIDNIELAPITVAPGQPNDQYTHDVNPLKKIPALILDNGDVIIDSYVIVEYLDELAGGGKLIPASGPTRWKVKSDHHLLQGMLDSMLLCRYEKAVRPQGLQWQAWSDDHWNRAWQGMARFDKQTEVLSRPLDIVQIALVCVLGYADFRFADCGWRKAYPNLDVFHEKMLTRPSVKISLPPPA